MKHKKQKVKNLTDKEYANYVFTVCGGAEIAPITKKEEEKQ